MPGWTGTNCCFNDESECDATCRVSFTGDFSTVFARFLGGSSRCPDVERCEPERRRLRSSEVSCHCAFCLLTVCSVGIMSTIAHNSSQ